MAGGIAVAVGLVGIGFITGRNSAPSPEAPVAAPVPPTPPAPVTVAVVPAALGRADLLALTGQAADAFASNTPMPAALAAAAGRRFDLILPFGCVPTGTLESPGAMRWSFDPKAARLKISVDPILWQAEQWGGAGNAEVSEGLRGFWVARPWSSATTCAAARMPGAEPGGAPLIPSSPTVAIARVAGPDPGGKVRPYEVVRRAGVDEIDPPKGFQFRIVGRLGAVSEGGPVKCRQPGGSEQPPICFIIGTFSEVRIENPKDGAVLANWPIGDDVRGDDSAESPRPLADPL